MRYRFWLAVIATSFVFTQGSALSGIVTFDINETFSQGDGQSDIDPAVNFDVGETSHLTVDPGVITNILTST